MFKFFVLSNSGSGEARRHFPFRSIIHKHVLPFFFVLVVLLFSSVPVHVSALAAPELNPVYNTDIVQIQEYVNGLSSGQMDVFNILLGFYLASQAGSAYYQLDNPYESQDGVLNWLKSCGVKFYNDFGGWFPVAPEVTGFDNGKLLSVILGAAILADQYSDQSDFVSDVQNSTHYFLPFDQSLQIGINQFLASNGGLYNWQVSSSDWVSDLVYNSIDVSSDLQLEYFNYLYPPDLFVRRSNALDSGIYNERRSSENFVIYHNLFFNTSSHYIYICDDYGNILPSSFSAKQAYFSYRGSSLRLNTNNFNLSFGLYFNVPYPSNVDVLTVCRSLFDGTADSVLGTDTFYDTFFISDFIDYVFYGSSWDNKLILNNDSDLNFGQSSSVSYDQVQTDLLLDIKGLLQDLLDTNELKQPVFDNFYDVSGQSVSDPATVSVSVNAVLPDSGIEIPTNIFGGFFNSSDGFISYLWYMTKPLVVYTHDLLDCFWFGPVDGFDWSGPAPIVFGVVSLGLIGGLIVKMLL